MAGLLVPKREASMQRRDLLHRDPPSYAAASESVGGFLAAKTCRIGYRLLWGGSAMLRIAFASLAIAYCGLLAAAPFQNGSFESGSVPNTCNVYDLPVGN